MFVFQLDANTLTKGECGHRHITGRPCHTCATGINGVIDRIPEGVPLTRPWQDWLGTAPDGAVQAQADGSLRVRQDQGDHPATIINRPRSNGTCSLAEEDGSWLATFATTEIAAAAARTRQMLRRYSRSDDTVRGAPCWLPATLHRPEPGRQPKRGRINISPILAAAMDRPLQQPPGDGPARQPRKPVWAHRVSFFVFNGHNPGRGTVDHACDVPACVNPVHLDDETLEVNHERGQEKERRLHPRQ